MSRVALNVTQNHLDRHHTFETVRRRQGAHLREPAPGRSRDSECRRSRVPSRYARRTPPARSSGSAAGTRSSPARRCAATSWCSHGKLLMTRGRSADPRPAQHRECAGGIAGRVARGRSAGSDRGRGAHVQGGGASPGVCAQRWTESISTTIRRPPAWTPRSRRSTRFRGGLWMILGGKDKGLDYRALREPLAAKAHAALLIGAAAGKIAERAGGRCAAGRSGDAGCRGGVRVRARRRRAIPSCSRRLRQLRPVQKLRASRRGFQANRESAAGKELIWRRN